MVVTFSPGGTPAYLEKYLLSAVISAVSWCRTPSRSRVCWRGDDCHAPHPARPLDSRRRGPSRPADGAGRRCPYRERSASSRDRLARCHSPLGGGSHRPAVPRPSRPLGYPEGRHHLPTRRRVVRRSNGEAEPLVPIACLSSMMSICHPG